MTPVLVHIKREMTRGLFGGPRYTLMANVHTEADERDIIQHHRLDKLRVFADPTVDDYLAKAEHAHEAARSRGLFVTGLLDAASVTGNEIRSLVSILRACNAFDLTLGDLLNGVSITHRDLSANRQIERIITEAIDGLDQTIQAARRYTQASDDLLVPGDEPNDPTVPPQQWTRGWQLPPARVALLQTPAPRTHPTRPQPVPVPLPK